MPSLHSLPGATVRFLVANAQGSFLEPPVTCVHRANHCSTNLVPVHTNQKLAVAIDFDLGSMPRAHLFTGTHVSVTLRIDGKLLEPVIRSVGQIEALNGSLLIDSVADIGLGYFVSPVFRSFAIAANAYLHPIALDAWLGGPGVIEVYVCHVTTRVRSPCHATVHPSSLRPRRHEPPAPVGSTHYTAYRILYPNMPQPLILEADELCGVPSTFIFRYGDVPALQNIANAHGVVFAGAQPAPANAPGASGVAQNGNPSASASAPVTAQPANSNAGLQVAQNGNPPAYALAPVTVERANNNAALQVAQNGTPSASASVPVTVQPANSNASLHVAPARPQRSTHEMVVDQDSTTLKGNATDHGAADAVAQDRPDPSSEEQKPSSPSRSSKRISAQAAVAVEGDPTSSDGNLKRKASSSPARSIQETTKMVKQEVP